MTAPAIQRLRGRGLVSTRSSPTSGGQTTNVGRRSAASTIDSVAVLLERFPYFRSTPVSYLRVTLQDGFWAPRQRRLSTVSIPWATRHLDRSGGVDAFRAAPATYAADLTPHPLEAIKFVEAMASVVGLERDESIEGLIDAWGKVLIGGQARDGYFEAGWPAGADPAERWQPSWSSHEDYALGHYLEASIAYLESTGKRALFDSAVRAAGNMATALVGSDRAYASGHPEIEQALTRLFGVTGERPWLELCGWLIEQRGHHEGRSSYGMHCQDHLPVREQRTIEGHAVTAGYLYNGVSQYVGATDDLGLREAMHAVWEDLVTHKMFVHGGGGNLSSGHEGYLPRPDFIPPNDAYCESCSVVANFRWAHSLFHLTGESSYLDVADRMLYNALYASLSLHGDRFFYRNVIQAGTATDAPITRMKWHWCPCCPPNIIKLLATVGGAFYATFRDGIFVKQYGSSEARIPFRDGVKLTQRTRYPWDGDVRIDVGPTTPGEFTLLLRVPSWAASHVLSVNGETREAGVQDGWIAVHRRWCLGDSIEVKMPMSPRRITMPPRFKEYKDLAALERGPLVYCLEQSDVDRPVRLLYLPDGTEIRAEYRDELLGGITVLRAELPQSRDILLGTAADAPLLDRVHARFIPYGVWNNREPDVMSVWLRSKEPSLMDVMF